MATGISPGGDLRDAVRALARRRLQPAVDRLRTESEADIDDVVHDVRKRCKRVRALLRLVRPGLDGEVYSRENRTLRDAARALSAVRDVKVVIDVYNDVVRVGAVPVEGLRAELVEHHERLRRQLLESDVVLPKLRESLAAAVARIDAWPMETVGWDVVGAGLQRVYRRGRKTMTAAYDDPSTETFHEWRNRAKYLRLQLGFLKDLWPEVVGGAAKSAHALTDVLGDEHDLSLLLAAQPGALTEFVEARQALLRARARPLGLRLYAEKPSRYIARLGRYWEAGLRAA